MAMEPTPVSAAAPWTGSVVFCNIGLPAEALRGVHWLQRRSNLLNLVMHWFDSSFQIDGSDLDGIFFTDIGGIHNILEDHDKVTFEQMIREAFLTKIQSVPQLLWPVRYNGTMAAFGNDVAVTALPVLTGMDGVDPWRNVERTEILGAAEHGCYKLLVYNHSQPSSKRRMFSRRMRFQLCKAMVADAINYYTLIHDRHADDQLCGIVFGGNSHCSIEDWTAAFAEFNWMEIFQVPQSFPDNWNGHLVAVPIKGFHVRFAFRTEQNPGHRGTIYFKWSCEL